MARERAQRRNGETEIRFDSHAGFPLHRRDFCCCCCCLDLLPACLSVHILLLIFFFFFPPLASRKKHLLSDLSSKKSVGPSAIDTTAHSQLAHLLDARITFGCFPSLPPSSSTLCISLHPSVCFLAWLAGWLAGVRFMLACIPGAIKVVLLFHNCLLLWNLLPLLFSIVGQSVCWCLCCCPYCPIIIFL